MKTLRIKGEAIEMAKELAKAAHKAQGDYVGDDLNCPETQELAAFLADVKATWPKKLTQNVVIGEYLVMTADDTMWIDKISTTILEDGDSNH